MVTMVTLWSLWPLYGQWCLIVPTNERPCRVTLEIVTVRVRRGRGGARHRANCSLLSVSSVQCPEPRVTRSSVQSAAVWLIGLISRPIIAYIYIYTCLLFAVSDLHNIKPYDVDHVSTCYKQISQYSVAHCSQVEPAVPDPREAHAWCRCSGSAPLSRPSDRAACPQWPPCPRPARRGLRPPVAHLLSPRPHLRAPPRRPAHVGRPRHEPHPGPGRPRGLAPPPLPAPSVRS